MRPLIGIPPCLDERGRWRTGREYDYIDAAYARAIDTAGAAPVYLPAQVDAAALVARLDGLLLPGGGDFAPPLPYPDDVTFDLVAGRQLAFDRVLLQAALDRDLPVLGICYGMQLLALHAGGALHFDLEVDAPSAADHQLPEREGRHLLAIEPGTRLAELLGPDPGPVNSLHHQAVSKVGADTRISARSHDGLIEAIELTEHQFALGVQWHPEKLEGCHRDALFSGFVRACGLD